MTVSLKHKPGILYFSSQLEFHEDDVFIAPGLQDIIFKMSRSLKYKSGVSILVFSLSSLRSGFLSTWTTRYNFQNDGFSKI